MADEVEASRVLTKEEEDRANADFISAMLLQDQQDQIDYDNGGDLYGDIESRSSASDSDGTRRKGGFDDGDDFIPSGAKRKASAGRRRAKTTEKSKPKPKAKAKAANNRKKQQQSAAAEIAPTDGSAVLSAEVRVHTAGGSEGGEVGDTEATSAVKKPSAAVNRGRGKEAMVAAGLWNPLWREGRWSDEEEKLFLEGLELHGRDWQAVSKHITTRPVNNVKSHAQKHFINVFKRGEILPAKVRETGEGHTLSGKPLDPESAAARQYLGGKKRKGANAASVLSIEESTPDDAVVGAAVSAEVARSASLPSVSATSAEATASARGAISTASTADTQDLAPSLTGVADDSGLPADIPVPDTSGRRTNTVVQASRTTPTVTELVGPSSTNGGSVGTDPTDIVRSGAHDSAAAPIDLSSDAKGAGKALKAASVRRASQKPAATRIRESDYVIDTKSEVATLCSQRERRKRTSTQPLARTLLSAANVSAEDPLRLVPCERYPPTSAEDSAASFVQVNSQPFGLSLKPGALVMMEAHAHLCRTEIIGLLAGTVDAETGHMVIEAAIPCDDQPLDDDDDGKVDEHVNVEMEPTSQIAAAESAAAAGLKVVGWYHSHPVFEPTPSVRDIENQLAYQRLYGDGNDQSLVPFVGIILSPYDLRLRSLESATRAFHVVEVSGESSSKRQRTLTAERLRDELPTPFELEFTIESENRGNDLDESSVAAGATAAAGEAITPDEVRLDPRASLAIRLISLIRHYANHRAHVFPSEVWRIRSTEADSPAALSELPIITRRDKLRGALTAAMRTLSVQDQQAIGSSVDEVLSEWSGS